MAVIDAYIKKNGNREITGEVLNGVLHSIVEGLDYDKAIAALQPKSAPSLATKDKTVVGSINEIYNSLGSIDAILDEINGEDAI